MIKKYNPKKDSEKVTRSINKILISRDQLLNSIQSLNSKPDSKKLKQLTFKAK